MIYFHSFTNQRKKKNTVKKLKASNVNWVEEDEGKL